MFTAQKQTLVNIDMGLVLNQVEFFAIEELFEVLWQNQYVLSYGTDITYG